MRDVVILAREARVTRADLRALATRLRDDYAIVGLFPEASSNFPPAHRRCLALSDFMRACLAELIERGEP
jgi:hypothetical protein